MSSSHSLSGDDGPTYFKAIATKLLPRGLYDPIALLPIILVILSFRYIASKSRFLAREKRDVAKKVPPVFPHYLPLIGTLPLGYLWDPMKFVLNPNSFFQSSHPVRAKVLWYDFYIVQGAENIKQVFKNSWVCTSIPFVEFALGYAFGLPPKALSLYRKDDSGGNHVPYTDSTVEARNRIDYNVHQSMVRFLEGKGLIPFWNRFVEDITTQFGDICQNMDSTWHPFPDLMQFVGNQTTASFVSALCGPHLLRMNSDFLEDFWVFDRNLQTFLQGTPWILAPRAYASRKRVLNAVKTWQQYARDNYTDAAKGPDGDDPFWGSSFFRDRQEIFLEMDGFDHAAIASEDFGAIWAGRNSVNSACWTVFEIYRDPELLAQVRAEVDSCVLSSEGGPVQFDIDRLLRQPILQAVYAETLRLKMHFYVIRMPDKVDMEIRDWVIPRRKIIVTSTTAAHMDPKAFETGLNNEHPVDTFWPGRFLKYPTDGSSADPTFSTKDLEGSWIPYGGGPRQCPGRHFAKRQILLTTALMVTLFDCEISEEGLAVKEDLSLKGFGGGISHPDRYVPCKIRRRDRKPV